jgi:hypothetical protein
MLSLYTQTFLAPAEEILIYLLKMPAGIFEISLRMFSFSSSSV